MLLAARRPDLVAGLVLAEAGPGESTADERGEVVDYLRSWPAPFPDETAARRFFAGSELRSRRWAAGLRRSGDGLHPRFHVEVLAEILEAAGKRSYWKEWATVACPILVAVAGSGTLGAAELSRMQATNINARFCQFEAAGHDLHLDALDEWVETLKGFIAVCG